MCKCTPSVRTPFCGKEGCEWPNGEGDIRETAQRPIQVGDRVRCGVYVLGEWYPTYVGIVVSQTVDGSVSGVDVMGLHGGAPWVHQEVTNSLRREGC